MIIAFTVNNRPQYLREVLESWREARGVGGVSAAFFCEPGCPEAVGLCSAADFFWSKYLVIHTQQAGVLVNPWIALSSVFTAGHDFAVLAEEDMVVSSDVIEYLSWASHEFEDDESVLAVSAHQHQVQPPGDLCATVKAGHFPGWVWGTWWDRWQAIGPDWDKDYSHRGWDHRLTDWWCKELGYQVVTPCVTRVQHIGQHGGTHCTPQMFEGLLAEGFRRQVPPQPYHLYDPSAR
jgi:hypothetical protein